MEGFRYEQVRIWFSAGKGSPGSWFGAEFQKIIKKKPNSLDLLQISLFLENSGVLPKVGNQEEIDLKVAEKLCWNILSSLIINGIQFSWLTWQG